MAAVRKIIQSRRRAPPEGAVLLEDAKKVCEGVLCSPGILVKVSSRFWSCVLDGGAERMAQTSFSKVLTGINLP